MFDKELEKTVASIKLVTGMGTPGTNEMCAMSMASVLTGEEFTDRPKCASPIVRQAVVLVNDNVDHETRQRLKVMVPHIIDTNDDMDGERIVALYGYAESTIFPAILAARPSWLFRTMVKAINLVSRRGVTDYDREINRIRRDLTIGNTNDGIHDLIHLMYFSGHVSGIEQKEKMDMMMLGIVDVLTSIRRKPAPCPTSLWLRRLRHATRAKVPQ